jgi:hypothetical protein
MQVSNKEICMKQFNSKLVTLAFAAVSMMSVVPFAQADRTIQGVATLSAPLTQATVKVLDRSGHVLAEKAGATSENGLFSIDVPTDIIEGLRVEASVNNIHVSGSVPAGFDSENQLVHLNAATTLVERYQELNPQADQQSAETRVREYLGLGETVSLGNGIENPYQTMFSMPIFESAAYTNGGLDTYTRTLAQEMTQSPTATRSFELTGVASNATSGGIESIAEDLAKKVANAAASEIFAKLQEGLGIKDKESQIFDLLNKIEGQIVNLERMLKDQEKAVTDARYEAGIRPINTEWVKLNTRVEYIMDQNRQAVDNMRDGRVIDATKAQRIATAIKGYENEIIPLANNVLDMVHANFVVASDILPLQQLFAMSRKGIIIDINYFNTVHGQLEKYRSYQATALALMAEIKRAGNLPEEATTLINVNTAHMGKEVPVYPKGKFFTLADTVQRVVKGQAFYDVTQDLVWETRYLHWDNVKQFTQYKNSRHAGQPKIPVRENIGYMLGLAGKSGNFESMARELGIVQPEVKMVVTNAVEEQETSYRVAEYFDWLGTDRDPRDSGGFFYHEAGDSFNRVRRDKGMPDGFYTLGITPLAELTK